MDKFDLVKFELGRDNSPFVWSESYTILTYCKHYPERKVGGEKYCQKCSYYCGLIDNSNADMSVKCSYKHNWWYKLLQLFK